jgi:hypothetical protein
MITKASITNALRYWELARIPYNLVLAAWSLWLLRSILTEMPFAGWMVLILAGVIANVAYTIVYPIDLAIQASDFADAWKRYGRPTLWLAGLITAALLATISLAPVAA